VENFATDSERKERNLKNVIRAGIVEVSAVSKEFFVPSSGKKFLIKFNKVSQKPLNTRLGIFKSFY
jgi:hypothetical protein